MTRITQKVLYAKVDAINRDLSLESSKGFCLEFAYGGVRLCKHYGEHGGLSDISERMTNREMAMTLDALRNSILRFNLKTVE